ncbi:MAG: RDD family protein [Spirochaetaceae bacterium]|nr:RDD family protein [Spirochaetaceae bacterium]
MKNRAPNQNRFSSQKTGLEDASFRVQTPEGIEYALYPAGLLIRVMAYGIDQIFLGFILIGVITLEEFLLDGALGIWFILLVRFVMDWFYHVFWELFFRGQSPGKKLMGIRVVRSDGFPVDAGSSLIRNLLRFVDTFMGLFIISFVSMAASPGFRRLGDWAGGTLVVHTLQSQAPERRGPMSWLGEFAPIAPRRPLSYGEKQGILMFARRYPLLGPGRAEEIARPLAALLQDGDDSSGGTAKPWAVPGAALGPASEGRKNPAAYLLGIARTLEAP